MRLSCTVFELERVICQKLSILITSTCIWRSRWGDPVRISRRSFASESFLCYRAALLAWLYVYPFWYNMGMWSTDRRTDTRRRL